MLRPTWTWPAAVDDHASASLARALGVPAPVGELLCRRGFDTVDKARSFLDPSLDELHDPFLMRDMDVAVARLEAAIAAGEKVVVHGDYDVDGITATALLVRYLRWRGASVEYYIPHRVEDGYGLSRDGVATLVEAGAGLLVTCDCGITAVEEVAAARRAGLDVIVTDHHEPGPELPAATALLDPKRADSGYPDLNLAAVGVAFKLCEALELSAGRDRDTLRRGLDLVALGTIADLVPVTGENRVLIRHGLEELGRTRNAGLKALLERTELARSRPSAWQVGFVLAPRINAVGRMDAAVRGVELLLSDDPAEAERIADALEEVNSDRQAADRNLLAEALAQLESLYDPARDRAIVLAGQDWHPGVIGIVASRVVERFHRPTVMIALDGDGRGRGSARSVSGFHLLEALTACAEHLDAFGGHRYAAGLAIRHDRVDAFREAFQGFARERIDPSHLVPTLTIDLELPLQAIDAPLYQALGRFGPYGPGNPEPVVAVREVSARGYPRIVGENHLKMLVAANGRTLDTIGFNLGTLMQELDLNRGPLTIACRLRENTYLGRSAIQGRLIDVLPGNGRG
ncbi:MAG TPA: single-stranded-DNA-specific exonuclease RecJ [Gemmatimonadota bacterium]|nr:single-stranded-DNA-specific exonuclease RecJ [Gemmatimonadota bacterium]